MRKFLLGLFIASGFIFAFSFAYAQTNDLEFLLGKLTQRIAALRQQIFSLKNSSPISFGGGGVSISVIPLSGSSAITGALTSNNSSNLGSSANRWGSAFIGTADLLTLAIGSFTSGNLTVAGDLFVNGGDINLGTGQATSTLTVLNGRFGIGTTTPGAIFSFSAGSSTPAFLVNQTGTGELFTVQDSGATSFVVRDGGNVGIGTHNVRQPLDISGGAMALGGVGGFNIRFNDTATNQIQYAASELGIYTNQTEGLRFYTAGTGRRVVIADGGNVAIGNFSSPSTLLDIAGDVTISGGDINLGTGSATTTLTSSSGRLGIASTSPWGLFSVESDNSSVGTGNPIFVVGDQGTTTPLFLISGNNGNIGIGTTTPSAKLGITSLGTGTGRAFAVADSSNTERFTILDNGNVGIGTTSPSVKLTIAGTGTGNLALIQNTGAEPATLAFRSTHSADSNWRIGSSILVDSAFEIYNANDAATRFLIDGSGNVGIGTTTPARTFSVATSSANTLGGALISSQSTTTLKVQSSAVDRYGCIELAGGNRTFRIFVNNQTGTLVSEAGVCE